MPLINLIQEQRALARKTEAKARILFFGFVGVASVSLVSFGFFMFQTDALMKEEATLQAQTQKMQPVITKIETDERAFSALQPRLRTLEDAIQSTDKWTGILNHLMVQTPRDTWLTGIRTSGSDPTKPITVSFIGLSAKQQLIGEFIMRLQNCKNLENVGLKYTQEKIVDRGTGIEFEVSADVVGTVEEKPKEEKSS